MTKNQRTCPELVEGYVIGVDGGGTDTTAVLANIRGKILTKTKAGPSNPRNIGIKKSVFNVSQAVKILCRKAKKDGKILSTFIALPAVEEEYRGKKKEILRLLRTKKEISKIFQGKVMIGSDQEADFRAGTNEKDGILLIAGTGAVCHGWRGRKEAKASGWGWLTDEGSAIWIGQKVFQKILKDLDGRGEKTILSRLAFQKFRVKNITDFLKKIYSGNPTETIPQLSIICDQASKRGDKVAKKIMTEAGNELALMAKKVIKELNFQRKKFPLVLIGSIFKSKIVLNQVQKKIKKVAFKVQFIQPKNKSAAGAVKLAIDQIGA